jgi:hypothetical protein
MLRSVWWEGVGEIGGKRVKPRQGMGGRGRCCPCCTQDERVWAEACPWVHSPWRGLDP